MSDTGSETQVAQQPPKLESHAVVDNGANGERLFAAQVAGLPTQAQIEATMANFQADQDAAFQARQVRERLVSAAATEPKISTAMAEGRANLDMMQHSDPAQAAEVQRLSDALKVRTGEHATGQMCIRDRLSPARMTNSHSISALKIRRYFFVTNHYMYTVSILDRLVSISLSQAHLPFIVKGMPFDSAILVRPPAYLMGNYFKAWLFFMQISLHLEHCFFIAGEFSHLRAKNM